ncbi:MAG: TRAP transporter small permease [Chloroflexi bacterium]|nr:TRAP transporter small permease [Chloroflexota bacterium]
MSSKLAGFRRVVGALAVVACAFLFAMMLVIVADIVLRFFGMPIKAGLEIIELMMVCVVYLGFAFTQMKGGWVRMELLISRLPSARTWYTEYLNYILTVIFFIIVLWQGIILGWQSVRTQEMTFGIVPMPIYPARIALAIGAAFVLLEVIAELILHHGGRKEWLQK